MSAQLKSIQDLSKITTIILCSSYWVRKPVKARYRWQIWVVEHFSKTRKPTFDVSTTCWAWREQWKIIWRETTYPRFSLSILEANSRRSDREQIVVKIHQKVKLFFLLSKNYGWSSRNIYYFSDLLDFTNHQSQTTSSFTPKLLVSWACKLSLRAATCRKTTKITYLPTGHQNHVIKLQAF